jgi:uncharacterized protein YbjT (DUF2867 family)
MNSKSRKILVMGATGQQGGAVVKYLLAEGWFVRVLLRNTNIPVAEDLARKNVEILQGDMNDIPSLITAMKDVYGVFSVQPTAGYPGTTADFTVADEICWGMNVATVAAQMGIRHFVYTSVAGAERNTGISRWESKWEIEEYIRKIGLPATILRPVRFMENHCHHLIGIRNDSLTDVYLRDTPVQLIAVDDIGAFALLAFNNPTDYLHKTIEIAGDTLSMPAVVSAISEITGRTISYHAISPEIIYEKGGDLLAGYLFANEKGGWQADISLLKQLHPGLINHDTWLKKEGKFKFEALFNRSK